MRFGLVALAALCLLVFFTGLGSVGWLDVREARDQAVARELLGAGDALTPRLGGVPWFDKPAAAYALDAACARWAGAGPAASRTVRGLLAVALVALTGGLAARRFGRRAGLFAALVLATSVGPALAARSDGTQLLATLLGWAACAAFARPALDGTRSRVAVLGGWAALGLTLLVAGPLPALWPLAGIAVHLALARRTAAFAALRPLPGAALALAIALPWYLAMLERHGAGWLGALFAFPYAANLRLSWLRGPLDALVGLIAAGFPWSALLPGAAFHAGAWWMPRPRRPLPAAAAADPTFVVATVERQLEQVTAAQLVTTWLLVALLPVVVYPRAPLSAALPALPALAILCGRLLDHLFEDPRRVAPAVTGAARILALIGTVAAVFATMAATRLADAAAPLRLLAAVLLVSAWAPMLAGFIGRRRIAALLFALPVAAGAPILSTRVVPALEDYLNARAVGERMARAAPPGAPLMLIEPPPPSLRLWAGHALVLEPLVPEALARRRATDGATYLAFRPARERAVMAAVGGTPEVLVRTPALILARVPG